MWIFLSDGANAINLDHVSRLYVEGTGTGAALKADIAGKTMMVAYYSSKDEAVVALKEIMGKRDAGVTVVYL